MPDDPDTETLLAFHERRLPPAAMLRLDRLLLARCAHRAVRPLRA